MGASDLLELALAALLLAFALAWRPFLEPYAQRLAQRPRWCILLLAAMPIVLRLALLHKHPAPVPDIYDEFSHLLVADTLRHFRLANPAHPLHQFFETFFVLQYPTYSSIYPIGQGLVLALGWTIFGTPWAGVILPVAALAALCYWMLRGWTTPGWALAGGVLALMEFGPLNQWMNGYWGGALPAAAGCMVFGALPRLRREARLRDAIILGAGLAIHLLTRPYESIFLLLSVAVFVLPRWRALMKPLLAAALVTLPAISITLLQNKQVTGSWITLPYALSQYQYGVPAALTFEENAVPHRELTREQQLDYQMQLSFRGERAETLKSYLQRLVYRIRYYRFFFMPPLYLALPLFFIAMRDARFIRVFLCLLLFALGINFFPAFQYHYMAGVTCLFVLVAITGLEQLSRLNATAARIVFLLCIAQFALEYGLHVSTNDQWSMALRNPERRVTVNAQLAAAPGKQLVFVRYWPHHIFQDEWVYNAANIDGARVVWARDLGAEENEKLRQYYPDRKVWLLEPDARPPRLAAYYSFPSPNSGRPASDAWNANAAIAVTLATANHEAPAYHAEKSAVSGNRISSTPANEHAISASSPKRSITKTNNTVRTAPNAAEMNGTCGAASAPSTASSSTRTTAASQSRRRTLRSTKISTNIISPCTTPVGTAARNAPSVFKTPCSDSSDTDRRGDAPKRIAKNWCTSASSPENTPSAIPASTSRPTSGS